jgi:hypothetical protein
MTAVATVQAVLGTRIPTSGVWVRVWFIVDMVTWGRGRKQQLSEAGVSLLIALSLVITVGGWKSVQRLGSRHVHEVVRKVVAQSCQLLQLGSEALYRVESDCTPFKACPTPLTIELAILTAMEIVALANMMFSSC